MLKITLDVYNIWILLLWTSISFQGCNVYLSFYSWHFMDIYKFIKISIWLACALVYSLKKKKIVTIDNDYFGWHFKVAQLSCLDSLVATEKYSSNVIQCHWQEDLSYWCLMCDCYDSFDVQLSSSVLDGQPSKPLMLPKKFKGRVVNIFVVPFCIKSFLWIPDINLPKTDSLKN